MNRKNTVEIIALLFIVLFVYAALTKLLEYEKFIVQIGQSPLLTHWSLYLAWLVPMVELCIVVLLLFGNSRLIGLYASTSLMLLFTGYIILTLHFSDHVPCSCGGVLQSMTWGQHLVFNLLFVVAGGVAVVVYPQQQPAADVY